MAVLILSADGQTALRERVVKQILQQRSQRLNMPRCCALALPPTKTVHDLCVYAGV
jgi:hypothetical protein